MTGELADLAAAAARDAHRVLVNARRALRRARAKAARLAQAGVRDPVAGRRRGRLARAINDLSALLLVTARITEQARQRIARTIPDGASRVVSLHDRDARPIAKARWANPSSSVTRGRSSTTTTASSWITRCMRKPCRCTTIGPGDPTNQSRAGRAPRTVTADRGYGEAAIDQGIDRARLPHRRHPAQGHHVVVGDLLREVDDTVTGTHRYYIDVIPSEQERQDHVTAAVTVIAEDQAGIEQAKGHADAHQRDG